MRTLSDLQLQIIISKGEATAKIVREVIEYAEKELNDISAIVEKAETEVCNREDEKFEREKYKEMRVL